jgi:N-hydroxyarylamine O-acetyltransferase
MAADTVPDLQTYLDRVGYRGRPRADLDTLRTLHRCHLLAIPYENLDVQLGVPVSLDIDAIFRKLVLQRRGGWCYEMNGLLGWALDTIGFSLTRLAAGVMREIRGDAAVGNHLALWVHLEEPHLADVGFGDGILEPIPVRPGRFRQRAFEFGLEQLDDQWWRFHNQHHGSARSFDFGSAPADGDLLRRQCELLQTSPESPFTQVAVVQRHVPEGLALMRGRVLTRVRAQDVHREEIAGEEHYARVLREVFDLDLPDTDVLWRKVEHQHAAYLERLVAARQQAAG